MAGVVTTMTLTVPKWLFLAVHNDTFRAGKIARALRITSATLVMVGDGKRRMAKCSLTW